MASRLLSRIQKIPQPGTGALVSASVDSTFPDCAIARFQGAVTDENLDTVARSFDAIAADRIHYLIIDFSAVEDISPSGTGLMLALRQTMRDRGGELVLCSLRPRLERFIRTLGLEGFFSTAPDADTAVQSLKSMGNGTFPLATRCPACDTPLEIARPGRGRCQTCEAILTAFPDGTVTLG
jgi:anti-anti-sigma factor